MTRHPAITMGDLVKIGPETIAKAAARLKGRIAAGDLRRAEDLHGRDAPRFAAIGEDDERPALCRLPAEAEGAPIACGAVR